MKGMSLWPRSFEEDLLLSIYLFFTWVLNLSTKGRACWVRSLQGSLILEEFADKYRLKLHLPIEAYFRG